MYRSLQVRSNSKCHDNPFMHNTCDKQTHKPTDKHVKICMSRLQKLKRKIGHHIEQLVVHDFYDQLPQSLFYWEENTALPTRIRLIYRYATCFQVPESL